MSASKIKSFFLALAFLGGLELLTLKIERFWLILGIFLSVVALFTIVILRETTHFHFSDVVLPVLYFLSTCLFYLFIPRGLWQHVFIFISAIIFYFIISRGTKRLFPTWNWFLSYVTFFLLAAGSYGLFFHLYFPIWAVVVIVLAGAVILTYRILVHPEVFLRRRIFMAVSIGLVIAESVALLSLWPLYYLVIGAILLVAYYTLVELANQSIHFTLKPKITLEYLLFGTLALIILFSTSTWIIK